MSDMIAAENSTLEAPELPPGQRPWWLYLIIGAIGVMAVLVVTNEGYNEAFFNIIPGLQLTLILTVVSFLIAVPLGLLIGLGRISTKAWINTLPTTYIEFIRGVPMIVWIFTIALVIIPETASWFGIKSRDIPQSWRGALALSLFYAAFLAEVFRGGIQSVPPGTIEAGKALGLGRIGLLRKVTLPQAIRNAYPALANDLIALMKDTALVSVLAVPELTQEAKLYSGSSFRFVESYFILVLLYVALTLTLSLILRWVEHRIEIPGRVS